MKRTGFIIVLLFTASAFAADRAQIDRLIKPAFDAKRLTALVVGLIDENGPQTFDYGADADTIFEIGSISKVFTSLLLAEMVVDKQLSLEDDLQKLLPPATTAPTFEGKSIKLIDLATHRSGLPRLPDNFDPEDPFNPYADYDEAKLYEFISSYQLKHAPGDEFEYSNLAVGLLGDLLSRKAGKSYPQLLHNRICKPLGMMDTVITLNDSQKQRLASGHNLFGVPQPNWDLNVVAGAGGIRSTVNDMLKFAAASISPPEGSLGEAIKLTHQRRNSTDDRNDIAMGWFIAPRTNTLWHNGATGGYHCFIACLPAKKRAVVLLSNASTGLVDDLGTRVMKQLLGEPVDPPNFGN